MKNLRLHLFSCLIFLLAALYITFPLILHFTTAASGLGDELVITWIQNWVIHALFTHPLALFNAPFYYPYHDALAFSDILLPTSIFAAIPLWILKEPIVTFNFTQISSYMLLGFCTYMLCFYITQDFWASLLSGILLIFSPVTLDKYVHVQVLAIEGVPLAVMFFIKFLTNAKTRYLIISLIFFVLQAYNSFLPGYFILFGYFFLLLFFFLTHKVDFLKLITKKNISFVAIAFACIVPITLPYFHVSEEFHYTRDIRDAIHFAIQPEDLLNAGGFSRLEPLLLRIPVKQTSLYGEVKPGFAGGVLTLLSIAVGWYAWKKRKYVKREWVFYAFLGTALSGLILSFGPALHLGRVTIHHPFPIPLPYTLFYYLMPGFAGLRNSARWEMLFVLCIVICIAVILIEIFQNLSLYKRVFVYLLLIVFVIAEYNFPMHVISIPQVKNFPKEYAWLHTTPPNTKIIEMPIYNWDVQPYSYGELVRGYYNTIDFRTTMSGFSGFSPPPWQSMVKNLLATFPSNSSIRQLKNLKITYILVHKDEYDLIHKNHLIVNHQAIPDGEDVLKKLRQNKAVRLVTVFHNTYIFRVL